MAGTATRDEGEKDRIILGLLESVERDGGQSQRRLASELGIALGLVNAYLRRCVNKGLVKVKEAPARRYAYYLTPQGFAEKSRLTVEYLSVSFSFFRQARADCVDVITQVVEQGHSQLVLAGVSDLAEIARLCAFERGVEIAAVVDRKASVATFIGAPVVDSFGAVPPTVKAVMVTDLVAPREAFDAATRRFGAKCVWAPALLRFRGGTSSRRAS